MTQNELMLVVRKAPKKIKRKLYAYLAYDLYQKKNNKERMRAYRLALKLKNAKLNK